MKLNFIVNLFLNHIINYLRAKEIGLVNSFNKLTMKNYIVYTKRRKSYT